LRLLWLIFGSQKPLDRRLPVAIRANRSLNFGNKMPSIWPAVKKLTVLRKVLLAGHKLSCYRERAG
jgi:hypothetical protein